MSFAREVKEVKAEMLLFFRAKLRFFYVVEFVQPVDRSFFAEPVWGFNCSNKRRCEEPGRALQRG